MRKRIIKVALAIIIVAGAFLSWGYFSLQLLVDLGKTRTRIAQLETELTTQIVYNKRLMEQKIILTRGFNVAKEEIAQSKQAIEALEQDLGDLKLHADTLDKNNGVLRSRINRLALAGKKLLVKTKELMQEKRKLQARLHSVGELRRTIKHLKENPREQRRFQSSSIEDSSASGNKGYLIRRGKSTHKSSVDIRVIPVP